MDDEFLSTHFIKIGPALTTLFEIDPGGFGSLCPIMATPENPGPALMDSLPNVKRGISTLQCLQSLLAIYALTNNLLVFEGYIVPNDKLALVFGSDIPGFGLLAGDYTIQGQTPNTFILMKYTDEDLKRKIPLHLTSIIVFNTESFQSFAELMTWFNYQGQKYNFIDEKISPILKEESIVTATLIQLSDALGVKLYSRDLSTLEHILLVNWK